MDLQKLNFEFTTIELEKNKHGKFDLLISKVKVLDEKGKYVKFAKINEHLLSALKQKGTVKIKNNGL
jgi:hypothetical protein